MAGFDESPVSMAWMCLENSPKHSSMESNPERLPKTENHGVHACAGTTMASGSASKTIFTRSWAEKPNIGRPSEETLPSFEKAEFIFLAASIDGAKRRLWILRVNPP